jgi:hypothetical protein
MKNSSLQDATIVDGMFVFGGAHQGGSAAAGYSLEMLSLNNASSTYLVELETELRSLLRWLDPATRIQFSWSTDSDYRSELLAFHDRTETLKAPEWSARMRSERTVRYLERCEAGTLRRDRISVFVNRPWIGSATNSEEVLEQRFAAMAQGFGQFEDYLQTFAQALGGSVRRMDDAMLAEQFSRFLNPMFKGAIPFDKDLTCLENFQLGEGVGVEQPAVGFYLSGAYHGVIAIRTLPRQTNSGIIQQFTSLPICNVAMCVNVTPLDVAREIAKEEAEVSKLSRALRSGRHKRMEVTLAMRQERIGRLIGGAVLPFHCQPIIRVWDNSMDGVQAKLSLLKAALLRMQSCRPLEAAFPVSARNFFRASTPGWFDGYEDGTHYMDDCVAANLLPMSGSACQNLGSAEAIYDNGSGGLMGISGFSGEPAAQAPKHLVILGETGSGKSLFANDLLVQGHPHYGITVVIDNGNSYRGSVLALGGKTLIIEPNGEYTFNYLDCSGAPLTAEHLADAKAIILRMATEGGSNGSIFRSAAISSALDRFYRDVSKEWLGKGPENLAVACEAAMAFEAFARAEADETISLEAWSDYVGARSEQNGDEIACQAGEEKLWKFRMRERADAAIHRFAFTCMAREEMPTHSNFCDWLEVESSGEGNEAEEFSDLLRLLKPWKRTGRFGKLLDGVGTVSFDSSLIHLELGRISDAAEELRSIAVLLVCNHVRNELMRRPRSERKRVVFEELSALLEIPEGERAIREYFDRGRKNGIWVIAVAQQISGRTESSAFVSILGNAGQVALFRQSSVNEVETIAKAFRLPDSARDTLLNLPSPTREKGAHFIHCSTENGRPIIRSGTNVCHPEMLVLSGSSGDQFERLNALIRAGGNLIEKLAAESGN